MYMGIYEMDVAKKYNVLSITGKIKYN